MNEYKRLIKKIIYRYRRDDKYKTRISLYFSLISNLVFAFFSLLLGILAGTAWYGVLAAYYGILAVMRFLLLRHTLKIPIGKNLLSEWRIARICASVQTLLNLSLSGAVLMIMYQDKGFEYYGVLIYVVALYTFFVTTVAIMELIKKRKNHSPVILTDKMINLASALLSMLALETAMLSAFGKEMLPETKRLFIAATGAGIALILLATSSYMIVRSVKESEKIKTEKFYGRKKQI